MKIIFAVLSWAGAVGICLGQGNVNWNSFSAAAIRVQTNTTQFYNGGPTGGGGAIGYTASGSSGTIFYYELLYNTNFTGSQVPAPDYTALFSGTWRDTGLTATNTNQGAIAALNPNSGAVVPWDEGTTNNILLVGWSANLGTSWTVVSNELATQYWFSYTEAFFGVSATGFLTPFASTTSPGATVFGTGPISNGLPINSPDMQLYWLPLTIVTPEPSALALAGLGGLSLLFFRRQRR